MTFFTPIGAARPGLPFKSLRSWLPIALACLVVAAPAMAQEGAGQPATLGLLKELSASVEALTTRVSVSVVQVLVTGYGPLDDAARGGAGVVIGRQHSIGSGAIIDGDGYIITNAHVVAGAKRVQVVLHRDATAAGPVGSLAVHAADTVEARIVGVASDIDLALLKVDVTGLRPLPLANYDAIRQGELVFAFGSPEGMRNSVTMGVVSAVARQPDPDSAAFYVQTDAPINPGNSGGPLVNASGELVGVNTFILTQSGGSQGLGFAIPSAIVASVYPQLKKYGHQHRGLIGFNMQSITPALSSGLGLSQTSGVIVSDVLPGGAAEKAGLAVGDVVAGVNGKPVDSVPMLGLELSRYAPGDVVRLELTRGTATRAVDVPVGERPHPVDDLVGLTDPEKSAVPRLGIFGVAIDAAAVALLPDLRVPSGVFVAARAEAPPESDVPLAAGDVIHSVNNVMVRSVDALRVLVDTAQTNDGLILQIERNGQLQFVTCQFY